MRARSVSTGSWFVVSAARSLVALPRVKRERGLKLDRRRGHDHLEDNAWWGGVGGGGGRGGGTDEDEEVGTPEAECQWWADRLGDCEGW